MPKKITFGTLLAREMKRAGLNALQLAAKAGLSYNTVYYALKDTKMPRKGTRYIMAIALGLAPEHFEGSFLQK